MKARTGEQRLVDIGFAALPIFCSLLGAVLMVTLSVRQSGPQPLSREALRQLQTNLQRLRQATELAFSTHPVISNRMDLAECRLSLRILDRKLTETRKEKERLEQHVNAVMVLRGRLKERQGEMELLEAEIAQAKARVQKLLSQVHTETNALLGLLAGYNGPLVFVDCKRDEVVVYPGARKLAADAPAWEMQWLFEAIERAGFVALAARPASFEECYPRIKKLIFERVDESNQKRELKIGRCSFPIPESAPVEQYLPKGDA